MSIEVGVMGNKLRMPSNSKYGELNSLHFQNRRARKPIKATAGGFERSSERDGGRSKTLGSIPCRG